MPFDVGVLVLVPAIAGCVVVGFPLAMFAANAYLQVLQGTAAGAKTVDWPSDSIPEQFPKLFYVAWILLLVFGPAYVVGRSFATATQSSFLGYSAMLIVFWVGFPICQLSSLGGPTAWLPLWPELFLRLRQKRKECFEFYAISALVLVGFSLSVVLTFGDTHPGTMLLGVPLLLMCWLLYARVIGRLAFILRFTRIARASRKKKSARSRDEAGIAEKRAQADRLRVQQPSEQPPLQTPLDGPLQGYDVRFQNEPHEDVSPVPVKPELSEVMPESPEAIFEDPVQVEITRQATERRRRYLDPAQRWDEEDDDASAYVAHEVDVSANAVTPPDLFEPKPEEMRLLSPAEKPKKPRRFWTWDLFAFLWQPATVGVIVRLSILCFIVGIMFRIARSFAPGGD